jgi:hypothetical protein
MLILLVYIATTSIICSLMCNNIHIDKGMTTEVHNIGTPGVYLGKGPWKYMPKIEV